MIMVILPRYFFITLAQELAHFENESSGLGLK
jgi:hypothetical protein